VAVQAPEEAKRALDFLGVFGRLAVLAAVGLLKVPPGGEDQGVDAHRRDVAVKHPAVGRPLADEAVILEEAALAAVRAEVNVLAVEG
jgi:hypothetical protein